MYFEYVIFFLSALLLQVKTGQIAGSSCCDTSGTVPQQLENQSSNNATFVKAITSCGNNNLSKEYSYLTEAEEELICDSAAVERYRRASNSNAIASDGSKCTNNLLRARLALATANARATADEKQEVIVAAKTVPVPTQLIPPQLLHKQIIGMSMSPCPINVPAPSCSCTSFEHSGLVNTNSVNPIGNIINCRCTDLPRPLSPKPIASAGICAVPIRVPDADVKQTPTATAADVVAARLAQHRLLTQQANSGQCPCSTNLPAPSCGCSSGGSSNFISSNSFGSGGEFLVNSIGSESSPGIAIDTDVTLLGNLNVCGTMPFTSAVQFDGLYDTIGSGSVSFGCGTSEPVTQPPLSNAATSTATIDSCRRPDVDVPKAPTTLVAIGAGASQARIVDAGDGQSSTTTSPAAALSARLAQQRLLTGQQSITGQCPQPRSLPTPICGCSLGGASSSAIANSIPITQKLRNPSNNNAALAAALINSNRCPSFPGTLPAVKSLSAEPDATQSRVPDVDQQASATSMAAAVSARLAQHRLLTEQQFNNEQCPRCNSSPISKCSCSSSGSSSSVIIPSSGSSLRVTSIGSESMPGFAVDTDVALAGGLDVCGTLPFTSAVQFQGLYDTTGSGLVSFGCGESEPITQKHGNPNANKSAFGTSGTTTINSCGQLPKYTDTPRAPSTLVAAATDVGKLQTKMADVDETRSTNMAAVGSTRLAQQRLLKGLTAPKCDCGSTVSSNFVTNPSSGAGLPVTSISPEAPSIDVDADIGLFGNLNVSGELPFQSAVEFQGLYKTSGSGTVSFGCGDSVAITQKLENPIDNYTMKTTCQ